MIAAIERDENTVRDYDVESAMRLATLKLVGYTEVVHVLAPRLAAGRRRSCCSAGSPRSGRTRARRRSRPSTARSARWSARSRCELAPVRVNAIHPGVVGDSPAWSGKPAAVLDALVSRTPCGRLASMEDVAHATLFLLDNQSVNGVNLDVDGGWLLT